MNVIAFSLWGDKEMYLSGALENIECAKTVYPGWVCRFYVDHTVPEEFIDKLIDAGGEIIHVPDEKSSTVSPYWGMFWRFWAASDDSVDYFISRDADSRVNLREKAAVDEWIESEKAFHCMHDHPYHNVPVLGGMWGCLGGFIPNMEELIDEWGDYSRKGIDQAFLANVVWPYIQDEVIEHSNKRYKNVYHPDAKDFPEHPDIRPLRFVGEIIE